jgi:L-fucose isomerase-like protein
MTRFQYTVAASILHDEQAVEAIFSRYEPLLARAGGTRKDAGSIACGKGTDPLVLFILTGGTEGGVLDILSRLGPEAQAMPVLLAAHPAHNSLPAALEILARVRQDGGNGAITLLRGPDDEAGAAELSGSVQAVFAIQRMAELRIGAVGEPSEWLVASSQVPAAVAAAWGATMVGVTIDELRKRIEAVRKSGKTMDEEALAFWKGADSNSGPAESDLRKSYAVYRALRDIAEELKLDALTLRCFDLVSLDSSTGCYALSRLADEGIDAGCEGDVPSILALAWMRALTGQAAWMANPSFIDAEKGEMLLAHCTVPLRGLSGYGIRNHFESGLGVAIAGTFPKGAVTLARLGGASLREAWFAEAEVVESPRQEGLCRTQIVVQSDPKKLRELLTAPLGNHIVAARGSWSKQAERYLELAGRTDSKKKEARA